MAHRRGQGQALEALNDTVPEHGLHVAPSHVERRVRTWGGYRRFSHKRLPHRRRIRILVSEVRRQPKHLLGRRSDHAQRGLRHIYGRAGIEAAVPVVDDGDHLRIRVWSALSVGKQYVFRSAAGEQQRQEQNKGEPFDAHERPFWEVFAPPGGAGAKRVMMLEVGWTLSWTFPQFPARLMAVLTAHAGAGSTAPGQSTARLAGRKMGQSTARFGRQSAISACSPPGQIALAAERVDGQENAKCRGHRGTRAPVVPGSAQWAGVAPGQSVFRGRRRLSGTMWRW